MEKSRLKVHSVWLKQVSSNVGDGGGEQGWGAVGRGHRGVRTACPAADAQGFVRVRSAPTSRCSLGVSAGASP